MRNITHKVLPFETAQGPVPGHEIVQFSYDWLRFPIKQVVFENFDTTAGMMVEIHIHWTNWTKYMKKHWPKGGEVKAVILDDGSRVHASARICGHTDGSYDAAPLLCRDDFSLVTLSSGYRLMEIVGVRAWLHSARDAEATEKYLACPWERDNREFSARQAELSVAAPSVTG